MALVHKKILSALLFLFFLGLVIFYFSSLQTNFVRAGASHNLSGFAWADLPNSGVPGLAGWISFNSLNLDTNEDGFSDCTQAGCPPVGTVVRNHGVNVDATGLMSGYAWSDIPNSVVPNARGAGWISFNPSDLAGCPTAPCTARVDTGTGVVRGWARALAATDPQAGGWDGWISLNDANDPAGTPDYGVAISGCQWVGEAWGGALIGWVNFNSANPDFPGGSQFRVSGMCDSSGLPIAQLRIAPSGPIRLIVRLKPTQQLRAWYDADGPGVEDEIDVTDLASWVSSDSNVVYVDPVQGGLIHASSTGQAQITATYFQSVQTTDIETVQVLPGGTIKEISPD